MGGFFSDIVVPTAIIALESVVLLVILLLSIAYAIYVDRKVWAAVQMRRGPNVVGPWGLLQPFADLLKFVFKEPIIPSAANKGVFLLAPFLSAVLALSAWAVMPVGLGLVIASSLAQAEAVDFVRDVRPILQKHCDSCHGAEKHKSGLRLDVKSEAFKGGDGYGPAIVAGNVEESPLLQLIEAGEEDSRMPPSGAPLSPAEIATLKAWVEMGTPVRYHVLLIARDGSSRVFATHGPQA